MKKSFIHLLLLFIFIPSSLLANLSGTGSKNDPYTGTIGIGESFTISSTNPNVRYFTYITVAGGTLTINPGIVLYARAADSYITITGTGVLRAVGTAISPITFSSDNDGDGIIDGSWKNILFDYSTGASIIDNALIENGTGDETYFFGGGIDIWGNNITISNSTIRNCNNTWGNGGGIAVIPSGSNVSLINLKIHNNNAAGNGGGIFTEGNVNISGCEIYNNNAESGDGIYLNASGSIYNCLIHDNNNGEGIYSLGNSTNSSITNCIINNNNTGIYFVGERNVVNCTVVNNIIGIFSAASTAPKIVNTILWGNTNQYVTDGELEFAFCGIQGGLTGGTDGGGNKNINVINNSDTGPNFINPSSDFHINSWIAPLIDGGTDSYSGVTIPGTDREGKSRIGLTDIGSSEFFYYIWTGASGTTTWNTPGNWVGSPSTIPTSIIENKVLIPRGCTYYPTTASLSLSSRSTVIIEPQAGLTVTGATTVASGCRFLLKSDASGSANFITGSTVTGSFEVELFLAGGSIPGNKWHYVTPPIASISKNVLTTNINNPYNLLNYNEQKVTTDKLAGWNWHDKYAGTDGFSTLFNFYGYNVFVSTDKTAVFTGTIRNGTNFLNSTLFFTSTDPNQSGWNLIGNPFTSGVNANNFTFGGRLDIDKTVYFTRNNQYCAWSVGGQAGTNGATNIIPPMQGFFVHLAAQTGTGTKTLAIPATSRLYATSPLYKGNSDNAELKVTRTNPFLKFNISDGETLTDESIIYFFEDATAGFDGDYDAYKMLAENPAHPQIYSMADSIKMGINGLPLPETKTVIPLRLRIGVEKSYSINILNIENLSDYKVSLNHGSEVIDLKTNPNYSFTGIPGTMDNMSITIEKLVTGIPDNIVSDKENLQCWYKNGSLYLKPNSQGFENNSSVLVYDLSGNVIFAKNKLALTSGMTHELSVNLNNGLYIVKVSNTIVKSSKKLVVTQ